jgi:uncharacterized protein YjbI with pentapeptide repeats
MLEGGPPRYAWIFVCAGVLGAALLYYFVDRSYLWAGLLLLISVMFGLVVILPRFLVPDRPASTLEVIEEPEPRLRLQDDRLRIQNDARTALLQAATGIALLIGVFFTWKQLQYDRREALQIKDQSREQIELTRQGQVADRFTRAVDQLGSRQVTIRLGGIYGLETIADQSQDTRLLVFEVLTAYVRQHAKLRVEEDYRIQGQLVDRWPDVQAAMTVLGRRVVLPSDPPLNLRNVDLHGAYLRHAQLSRAVFDNSNLDSADLEYAILENTQFAATELQKARLDYAWARKLDAHDAHFEGAKFKHAELARSVFERSHLDDVDFSDASLIEADIKCVDDLNHSEFDAAKLQGAQFNRSNLHGAKLRHADLRGATATRDTEWPSSFDWRKAGIRRIDDQPNLRCAHSGTPK